MKKVLIFVLLVIGAVVIMAFTACENIKDIDNIKDLYKRVSQEDALQMMKEKADYIILDVRTIEEYESGHIPGAICIPNETIGDGEIAELSDKDQLIFIYCRSGNRSKQAAEKLVNKGYTNIVEFGGISTWTGEIVK